MALRPGRNNTQFIQVCSNIARFYAAELHLLRIADPDEELTSLEALRTGSAQLIQNCEVRHEVHILQSKNPVQKVLEISIGYDLLIIGTPGKISWIKVLLDSVVDEYAKGAPCSVLRLTIR